MTLSRAASCRRRPRCTRAPMRCRSRRTSRPWPGSSPTSGCRTSGPWGDSFQIFRGSSIRLSSRRACSSGLTSSQYLSSRIPQSAIAFSQLGTSCRKPLGLLRVAQAHDRSTLGPVVPAAVEDHDLAGGRDVLDVPLDVHLRLLPLGRGGQGHDPERPPAEPLGDSLDRAFLPEVHRQRGLSSAEAAGAVSAVLMARGWARGRTGPGSRRQYHGPLAARPAWRSSVPAASKITPPAAMPMPAPPRMSRG